MSYSILSVGEWDFLLEWENASRRIRAKRCNGEEWIKPRNPYWVPHTEDMNHRIDKPIEKEEATAVLLAAKENAEV